LSSSLIESFGAKETVPEGFPVESRKRLVEEEDEAMVEKTESGREVWIWIYRAIDTILDLSKRMKHTIEKLLCNYYSL
jgi:hypothetical protein